MSASHIHRIMDLKRSSPTPPDAPKKSRSTCTSPSHEELDSARIAGIHAIAAIMMEPKPFMPSHWIKKHV